MRIFRAAALAAFLAGLSAPALAQTPNMNLMPELPTKTPEEKEADAIRENAYRESLRKIPDAKTSTIRGALCAPPSRQGGPPSEDQNRRTRIGNPFENARECASDELRANRLPQTHNAALRNMIAGGAACNTGPQIPSFYVRAN